MSVVDWVVVTGATRGIGRGVSERLVRDGYGVIAVARDRDRLESMARELGEAAVVGVSLDLADPDQVDSFWSGVGEDRSVVGLVNNAAVALHGPAEEVRPADLTQLLDVNVRSVYQCCVGAFGIFRAAGTSGSIVNITSIEAHVGTSLMAAYCASKFAVRGLTQALAVEWARHRIRVNSVSPGAVHTDMTAHLDPESKGYQHLVRRTPMRRFARPEEVAGAVAYLLGTDASFVTGADVAVDGGFRA